MAVGAAWAGEGGVMVGMPNDGIGGALAKLATHMTSPMYMLVQSASIWGLFDMNIVMLMLALATTAEHVSPAWTTWVV